MKEKKEFVCYDCFKLRTCKESLASWIFFFIALVAVISLRAMSIFANSSPMFAKMLWYVGVGGFLIFFIYKFRYDQILQRELEKTDLKDKLLSKKELTEHDKEVLGTIVCKLSSKKDKINYFFIFVSSGLALAIAIWVDFVK
ncbi:MAG: hypothetical protein KKG01_05375 [Candidatus Omnitrophica bacterium]|nr:hypothetical protein [Candidatus Omnitrophota bacterium]MBU4590334.1 hypothetical protein [Candidatus Omnitrophota bacterium]